MDIKELKRKRDAARIYAAKLRQEARRKSVNLYNVYNGTVGNLSKRADLLDAIADNYSEKLNRIYAALLKAEQLIRNFKSSIYAAEVNVHKAHNLIVDLLNEF